MRLRFAQEMNGRWYPWSEVANGNHPGQYVRAWRHVHDIFTAAGAHNVQWVWSPVAITVHAEQYPGSAYVDWIGLSGFNGGSQLHYGPWRSFEQLFGPSLKVLAAIAPDKPIEISEVGTAEGGGDKATWITQMFAALARDPQIRSLVWYNLNKLSDWRVESSPAALAAFRGAVANPALPLTRPAEASGAAGTTDHRAVAGHGVDLERRRVQARTRSARCTNSSTGSRKSMRSLR